MPSAIKSIEAEAAKIRNELKKRYGLTRDQIQALPTATGLQQVSLITMEEILPLLMESAMTREHHEWLNGKPSGNLGNDPRDQPQGRTFQLNEEQKNRMDLVTGVPTFERGRAITN